MKRKFLKKLILLIPFIFIYSLILLLLKNNLLLEKADESIVANRKTQLVELMDENGKLKSKLNYYINTKIPTDLQDNILANRQEIFVTFNVQEFEKYLTPDYIYEDEVAFIQSLDSIKSANANNYSNNISHQNAKQEIEILMDYLKYYYAGYEYFGGEDIFDKLKSDMINDIYLQPNPFDIKIYRKEIIYKYLSSVIKDSHFSVDNISLMEDEKQTNFLYNEDFIFKKNNNFFYTEIDGNSYELISVNDENPSDMLKLFISRNGEPVWVIADMETKAVRSDYVDLRLKNQDTMEVINRKIEIARANFYYPKGDIYTEYSKDNVDIFAITGFPQSNNDLSEGNESMEAFVASGDKIRNLQYCIIDIRGNGGGIVSYPEMWYSIFYDTDDIPSVNILALRRSLLAYNIEKDYLKNGSYEEFIEGEGYIKGWRYNPYDTEIHKYLNTDTIIFVLIDQFTMSAGEIYLNILQQMENVVVVGTKTCGVYSFGNNYSYELPISKTDIFCGYALILSYGYQSVDGKGFEPDIWAPPNESLERTLKFIENYIKIDTC